MSTVFIALQANEATRPIIDAILADNPEATIKRDPAMVKINAPGHLVIRRSSIEEQTGGHFDLQELQVNLITLSGNVEETEDELTLHWNN